MKAFYFQGILKFLFLFLLLGVHFDSIAQDVFLKTQADVDAFDPAITTINGNLEIGLGFGNSSDIVSLANLSSLSEINGNLWISYNDDLTTFEGLNNLSLIVGDVSIFENINLTNLDAFSNFQSIGGFLQLNKNYSLNSIDGLTNLMSIGGALIVVSSDELTNLDGLNNLTTIGEYLRISSNNRLANLNGLSNLVNIGAYLTIEDNNKLTSIDLDNLLTIGGTLRISSNDDLADLDGFGNLSTIGGNLVLVDFKLITNLDGLSSLTTVGATLFITGNVNLTNINGMISLTTIGKDFHLYENESLLNLNGLSSLKTVDKTLYITDNLNLTNINGINSLTSIGQDFHISNNGSLTKLDGLGSLATIGGSLYIRSNNNLANIRGMISLSSIGQDIDLYGNDSLTNLDGFSNITSIGNNLSLTYNESLMNIDGLSFITSIGNDLNLANNNNLIGCCGIQNLLENQSSSIGGSIYIDNNPSTCSSEEDILSADCGMSLFLATTPPCIDIENGAILLNVYNYETTPFFFEWIRLEDGLTGNGESASDNFTIGMLGAGTYNITVTNATPDTVIKNNVVLLDIDGDIFEITQLKTTNSSNGLNNGRIMLTTAGGTAPYTYMWSGVVSGSESEVVDSFYTIPSLGYGEYTISIEDDAGASKVVEVSLLDEEVQVVACEAPLDIVILNDVSGSVDAIEYMESKQFFVDFLQVVNIGSGTDESRASIIEWSSSSDQEVKIPITGDVTILQSYIDDSRAFDGGTSPHEAMSFGGSYLDANARINAEKVLILSTDGSRSQISSSLITLADEFKAKGYHIISIAFDGAYSNNFTREILRQIASVDALAPGAPAYSQLNANLAKNIVYNYLCPIDPGSSATAYFNRDGAIDILAIVPIGNCPYLDFVEATIEISAHRELSIPAGTYVTFYHNNPNQSGATSILTWQIPCAIPVDSTETYTITLPMDGPSNIFVVLNDDGVQGAPINFPITSIEEIAYTNNIDNERICLDQEATIQALKYSTLPIPACDTLVNYTINVCNISEVDAFGITVEDIPPAGFALTGTVFNDNGCATDLGGTYDLPADCCFSLSLTYDAGAAEHGYYGDQDVILGGPSNQTYFDFDGSTTTDEDVTINGNIDCPSTNITFTKAVNIDESCDDGFVEFTFTITNEMNIPLKGLTFQDVLPGPCTWAYLPYGENGLSIANPNVMGEVAIFTIDEVQANTVATFHMDASLNFWSNDGTLNNEATLDNVPDVINGGFKTLTSNTTSTEITASPMITIPDTIEVNSGIDSVNLAATLSTFADVSWTTEGDGQFTEENDENTTYIFGTQDILNGGVMLFISAESDCNETGASVHILFSGCVESEDFEIQLNAENLTCEIDQVEIMVSSNIVLDSISWSGPSNDGLNGNNLLVSLSGEYNLIGYSGNCSDTVSIIVKEVLAFEMESYVICEGENIEINNEVYNTSGNYQQTLSSTMNCDTTLHIELEVLESIMSEKTYIIHSGEILDINGVQYDAVGQYMQDHIASNGCDSVLIINILADESLITFDFDDCSATIQTMENADYSEFTPYYNSELDCGSVTSSNIYREDPSENMHSCTDGLNDSYSMCISSDSNCEFDKNSTKMVRMDIAINPDPNREIVLTGIEFFQQAPEMFDWIDGDDGENNYPTKFGLRILKDGDEIYYNANNPTTLTWQKEEFIFLNNDDFVFTESTTLEIQLLSYCPIGVNSPVSAWDLEDLKIFGSCSSELGNLKVIAGTVLPCASEVLEDVQILIDNDSETKQVFVDEHGDYSNLGNLPDSHINITAHKDDDHLKGVSTLDLLMIQRHLLGLDNFENPLQYIAADMNYDRKVSVTDLRELRKLILGIYSELPSNYSYRFLSKKEVQKENAEPWEIPENIEIQILSDHILDADFVPVKIGDVSNQNMEYLSGAITSKNEKSESLYIVKQQSSKDSHYSLIFNLGHQMSVNGLHFSLDLNGLNFVGVETHLNNFTEDNFNLTDDGILHISWADAKNNENASSHLFTLNFEENDQREFLNEVIKSEVYVKDKIYRLEPNYEIAQKDVESISNLIVYPNPVNAETIIYFDHKKASNVIFSVQNLEGKLVYKDVFNSSKGSNKIQIPQNVLQQNPGIFIIRLTDQHTSLIEKIMIAG